MSIAARTLKKMYDEGKIGIGGLQKAVEDGVITEAEMKEIIGQ